jgi:PAS domain S-box-containing protein
MSDTAAKPTFHEYLTVAEAAEFLGVSPWTLRNWDNAGKLKPDRHPINGYRIYRREDLESVLTGTLLGKRKGTLAPNFDWNAIGASEHFVQFYETDGYLVESVAGFLDKGLRGGEAAIIIATPEHRTRIEKNLNARGVAVSEARSRGQYVALDAAATLAAFMDGDAPDARRFAEAVGEIVVKLARNWPRVRAFGEMVALLWEDGKREAARHLEDLWNDLRKKCDFALFCAYPMKGFGAETDGPGLSDVCSCHTRVIPAESYAALTTSDLQLRAITLLQQKAAALEAEVARRKQVENEFSDFLENVAVGLHKVGPDGTIIWANKTEFQTLGYEPDEYIGHDIRKFHANQLVIDDMLARLQRGEALRDHPAQLRRKDGSLCDVLISANALFEDGNFVHSRCFTRDVTERNRAYEVQARLAAIVDSSQDAIVSKTLDGVIRSWNAGAQRLFGYSAAEAVGQSITLIIPPELRDEEKAILERLRRGERVEHFDTERVCKDGRRVHISLTVSPVRDADGRIVGASKVARDITERKQAEERVRLSEERYRRLTQVLPVGVYTCDAPSGVITYYNDQAVRLWGRAPELGETSERYCGSFKMFRPDGAVLPHPECPMSTALSEGRSFRNQQVVIERTDGSRITALVNIDPVRDAEGRVVGAVNVFLDVTALKQAEQALRDADRRKDEFLATLAHELRNPLAPIRNCLRMLRLAGASSAGPAVERAHEVMERQVAHMVRLVDDLLELSRISRGTIELKKERVELATVINHALETSKPLIEAAGHRLSVSLPSEPIRVDGDPVRLSQVFANLLNNAAKYTEQGGNIAVAARLDGGDAVVSVRDTGIGIARDMLARVFEMFAQVPNSLRRSQDGLGIGLNLVRTLVTMHGGSVTAQSDGIGQGSEFVVRLPVALDDGGALGSTRSHADSSPIAPTHRILVVDDNRDAADSLAMLLRFSGADVHVAYDGASALEAIRMCRPSVVFLDLGMPGMDGYEVARRVRQNPHSAKTMLIALTGWGQESNRRSSEEAGFNHHLVKPVDFGSVQAVLASSHGPQQ